MSCESINDQVQSLIAKYEGEEISIAGLLCDNHAETPEKVGLIYENGSGESIQYTFAQLKELSSKFAGALAKMGIRKGDRVGIMLPKCPEMVIAALGIWRLGAVYLPLFTAFGPEAIKHRVIDSGAKMVITDDKNYPKLQELLSIFPVKVVVVSKDTGGFWDEIEKANPVEKSTLVEGDDLVGLLYTSGTTGNPKGVEIPVKALASMEAYMRFALEVREEDVYLNLADPGWAYGLYFNLIGPLLLGKEILFYGSPFNPLEVYRVMEKYHVTNFAAAPTAYKGLMNVVENIAEMYHLNLRVASSAGEPLNPSIVVWARQAWGIPIYDHFGQTELGMTINNHHHPDLEEMIKPGSMGKSTPGFRMVVLDGEGRELAPNQEGQLAVDTLNSPLCWFKRYWNDVERTKSKYSLDGRYILVGDEASIDDEGYFFFSGRADDIILSAGYRIGPFEVESVLMEHHAVAEVAVIGVPDELRNEVVKAYVVLTEGVSPGEELGKELSQFVKERLSAHEYPRQVEFLKELPKTPSGKIQRFLLKTLISK